jgi:hypothetical protein
MAFVQFSPSQIVLIIAHRMAYALIIRANVLAIGVVLTVVFKYVIVVMLKIEDIVMKINADV